MLDLKLGGKKNLFRVARIHAPQKTFPAHTLTLCLRAAGLSGSLGPGLLELDPDPHTIGTNGGDRERTGCSGRGARDSEKKGQSVSWHSQRISPANKTNVCFGGRGVTNSGDVQRSRAPVGEAFLTGTVVLARVHPSGIVGEVADGRGLLTIHPCGG